MSDIIDKILEYTINTLNQNIIEWDLYIKRKNGFVNVSKNKLEKLISKGKLDELFDIMIKEFKYSDHYKSIIILAGKYETLIERENITGDNLNVEKTKITNSLVNIIQKLYKNE